MDLWIGRVNDLIPVFLQKLRSSIGFVSTSVDPVSVSSADFLQELLSRKFHTGACTVNSDANSSTRAGFEL